MKKVLIATDKAPKAVGAYSQGVRVSAESLIFLSGQIAVVPETGEKLNGTAAEQAEQILKNVGALLADQGLTSQNVVKTTIFLTDIADFASVNEVYARFFGASLPARSCVAVSALPLGMKAEIEIIAAK